MRKDIFDGFGDPFEEHLFNLFGNSPQRPRPKPKIDPDPRRTALFMTFTKELANGDRAYLEQAVVEYREEVYKRSSDSELIRAYALAAVFAGKLSLGYNALQRMENPNERLRQARAILAYEIGNVSDVRTQLDGIKDQVSPARLVYSLILYNEGKRDPQTHTELLESILERSGLANTIVGTIYFNSGDTNEAEKFFDRAVQLSPNSERNRLNLMRAQARNGKFSQMYAGMNEFYVRTNSSLSAKDIEQEVERETLEIPSPRMTNLFDVIKSLI